MNAIVVCCLWVLCLVLVLVIAHISCLVESRVNQSENSHGEQSHSELRR